MSGNQNDTDANQTRSAAARDAALIQQFANAPKPLEALAKALRRLRNSPETIESALIDMKDSATLQAHLYAMGYVIRPVVAARPVETRQ